MLLQYLPWASMTGAQRTTYKGGEKGNMIGISRLVQKACSSECTKNSNDSGELAYLQLQQPKRRGPSSPAIHSLQKGVGL